jgi:hypothetical protein
MWEPQHLTTLWAFTACYRNNFTYFIKHFPMDLTDLMERSLFEKLIVAQTVKTFSAFYGAHRFMTIFPRAASGACAGQLKAAVK